MYYTFVFFSWNCHSNHYQTRQRKGLVPCKRIHEGPGFRIPASGFWIPTLMTLSLDSGFQPSVFRIPYESGFRIPTAKICRIPESRFSKRSHSTEPNCQRQWTNILMFYLNGIRGNCSLGEFLPKCIIIRLEKLSQVCFPFVLGYGMLFMMF